MFIHNGTFNKLCTRVFDLFKNWGGVGYERHIKDYIINIHLGMLYM